MDGVKLIFRVLSGDASDEEKVQLDNWISQSDGNKEEYLYVKLLWENRPVEDESNVEFPERLSGIARKDSMPHYLTVAVKAIKYLVVLAILLFLLSLIYRAGVSKSGSRGASLSRYSEYSSHVCDRKLENE